MLAWLCPDPLAEFRTLPGLPSWIKRKRRDGQVKEVNERKKRGIRGRAVMGG